MTISEALIQAKEQGKSAVLNDIIIKPTGDVGLGFICFNAESEETMPTFYFSELTSNEWRVE